MTETIQQPKRGPGRPRIKILAVNEAQNPMPPLRYVPADNQPVQAVRFKEAAPIGFANRAETSASTSADGRMIVNADWTRRVIVVLTKEGSATCETLIPLENVKSMRPMPVKAEAVA